MEKESVEVVRGSDQDASWVPPISPELTGGKIHPVWPGNGLGSPEICWMVSLERGMPWCPSWTLLPPRPDLRQAEEAWFVHLGLLPACEDRQLVLSRHVGPVTDRSYSEGVITRVCGSGLISVVTKGQYRPGDLLCPETYVWVSIERCIPLLDSSRYARLHQDPDAGDARVVKDIGRALVLHKRTVMPYAIYSRKRKGPSDEAEVQQYASLVGQDCVERILLYRS
ncbi:hypothetical protein CHARACLAT_009449 [Characodon lateralis]|uniref:Uncharacterized protein n=1 Tax=Characodon lateralis TaxID=208331 RepID=A0ABU7DZZ4_9TELE|nr:hypothetical protein [Characodon lateralis]